MASVSNLDQDMKRLRLSRYTPQAAKEVRTWIEDTLGENLAGGDLLEALKDGTVLCKLINRALPSPGIKFKKSSMPFVQMENISHFLRACENPPFNMQAHDRFLTVDLYESKDPAQVLQCISAFSRIANAHYPNKFPTAIGPKRTANPISPAHTGASNGSGSMDLRSPDASRAFNASTQSASPGRTSPTRPQSQAFTGPSSILYAGYMGGASQGNQGISFGGRRQITAPAPFVPTLADKERKRREKEEEDARLQELAKEAEVKRRVEREAEEQRERVAEEQRWDEEARKLRDEEKRRVEQEKREWEEEERKWQAAEEERLNEEREAQSRAPENAQRSRGLSDVKLRGQYLSEYKAEEKTRSRQSSYNDPERFKERQKIEDLERQLAEAQERERKYQEERQKRGEGQATPRSPISTTQVAHTEKAESPKESDLSWTADEKEDLRRQPESQPPDRLFASERSNAPISRPLPNPTASQPFSVASRPLPNPEAYTTSDPALNRTERYLSQNKAPEAQKPQAHYPAELGFTSSAEQRTEDTRRAQSQTKTKAGGWASKSLLEREMERERERQREWEEAQKTTQKAPRDASAGVGAGQSWDVNQYGFVGGDSQNRVSSGIGFGAKRQIIGPRPPP